MGSRAAAGCSVPNARACGQSTYIKKRKRVPYRLGNAEPGSIIAYSYLLRVKRVKNRSKKRMQDEMRYCRVVLQSSAPFVAAWSGYPVLLLTSLPLYLVLRIEMGLIVVPARAAVQVNKFSISRVFWVRAS